MGCCKSKTTDGTTGPHRKIELRSEPPQPFVPGPVTNFNIVLVQRIGQSPSISLSWRRPRNCTSGNKILQYHINVFTSHFIGDSTNRDCIYKLKPFKVPGNLTTFSVTREDGLFPLVQYAVKVEAESRDNIIGETVQDLIYIDWQCRLPTCNLNRIVMNPECTALHQRKIYEFCSLKHKVKSDQSYCLYSECTNVKLSSNSARSTWSTNPAKFPTTAQSHFCSQHRSMAKTSRLGFFLEVEPSSKEFKKVKKKFIKKWSPNKGKCPEIEIILAVVNPALEDQFYEYKKEIPSKFLHSKSKKQYHGTQLQCMLDRYQTPCTHDGCGICGISTTGFQHSHIRTDAWQRYGQGFYFAPNSSKARDYCSKPENGKYKAMLVCQVATGKAYALRKNKKELKEPPEGYHSVHGKRKSFLSSSTLNYDERIVYTPDASCPRYVLLFVDQ